MALLIDASRVTLVGVRTGAAALTAPGAKIVHRAEVCCAAVGEALLAAGRGVQRVNCGLVGRVLGAEQLSRALEPGVGAELKAERELVVDRCGEHGEVLSAAGASGGVVSVVGARPLRVGAGLAGEPRQLLEVGGEASLGPVDLAPGVVDEAVSESRDWVRWEPLRQGAGGGRPA